jgi:hypothetical protein
MAQYGSGLMLISEKMRYDSRTKSGTRRRGARMTIVYLLILAAILFATYYIQPHSNQYQAKQS